MKDAFNQGSFLSLHHVETPFLRMLDVAIAQGGISGGVSRLCTAAVPVKGALQEFEPFILIKRATDIGKKLSLEATVLRPQHDDMQHHATGLHLVMEQELMGELTAETVEIVHQDCLHAVFLDEPAEELKVGTVQGDPGVIIRQDVAVLHGIAM